MKKVFEVVEVLVTYKKRNILDLFFTFNKIIIFYVDLFYFYKNFPFSLYYRSKEMFLKFRKK